MSERKYTRNGEWAAFDGTLWRVGLSASAVEELGDVTFVDLPKPGKSVLPGEAVCTIEAVKAATDYYSPLEGVIAGVNSQLATEPSLLNLNPETDGWIFALENVSSESLEALMDEKDWKIWESGR